MMGFSETLIISQKVCSPAWDTSTIMPNSLQRRITSLPKSVNPTKARESFFSVSSFADVAQSLELFQVTLR